MFDAEVLKKRIEEAERYLDIVDAGVSSNWDAWRVDAEALSDAALGLSLIHPDNWLTARGRDVRGSRAFRTAEIFATRVCSAPDYWGIKCRTDTRVEGAVADHAWPYALGGPTIVGNIAWLCPRHNQAKGVDIHFYLWERGWPDWLAGQLARVEAARKSVRAR